MNIPQHQQFPQQQFQQQQFQQPQQQHSQHPPPPYLFFSPSCQKCMGLIELIKKNQTLAKNIQPINIHVAKSLPKELVGVPTIMVNGYFIYGTDAFKWVQMQLTQSQQTQQTQQSQQQYQQSQQTQQQPQPPNTVFESADISESDDGLIRYTPLGSKPNDAPESYKPFSYLDGASKDKGIDISESMSEPPTKHTKGADVSQRLENLQKMRDDSRDSQRGPPGGAFNPYAMEPGPRNSYGNQPQEFFQPQKVQQYQQPQNYQQPSYQPNTYDIMK